MYDRVARIRRTLWIGTPHSCAMRPLVMRWGTVMYVAPYVCDWATRCSPTLSGSGQHAFAFGCSYCFDSANDFIGFWLFEKFVKTFATGMHSFLSACFSSYYSSYYSSISRPMAFSMKGILRTILRLIDNEFIKFDL
jgi:hypothetical protein